MPTLADIELDWAEIERLLDEAGGEITPEIAERMERYTLDEADKVDAYIHVIKDLRGRAKLAREQAGERLSKAEHLEDRAHWLIDRLREHMAMRGTRELKGHLLTARLQRNGGKPPVEVLVEANDLPYPLSVPLGRKANLKLLAEALDDPQHPYHNEATQYARLGERGESVRFY